MKSFLEEYGLIIVAIIVVAALIGLSIYFKNNATTKAQNNFTTFTNKADQIVTEKMNDAAGTDGTGGTGGESGGTGGTGGESGGTGGTGGESGGTGGKG